MAKDMKKESKGKPKKTPAAAASSSSIVGQPAMSSPAGKSGANVKPNPGNKR
jgi:hypothetical protein